MHELEAWSRAAPGWQALAAWLLLVLARVLPAVLLGPWLAARAALRVGPLALAATLALAMAPVIVPVGAAAQLLAWDASLLASLGIELVRGTLFGLALVLPLHAFAWAGALAEVLRISDTDADAGAPALAELARAAAVATFFASGAHRLVLDALARTARAHPLGALPPESAAPAAALRFTAQLIGEALSLAFSLLAPLLLCGLLAALVLVLLRRVARFAVPLASMPIWQLAMLGVLALVLSRSLPALPAAARVFLAHAEQVLRMLG
jgi:flagellar biosynthetic protein FliR